MTLYLWVLICIMQRMKTMIIKEVYIQYGSGDNLHSKANLHIT